MDSRDITDLARAITYAAPGAVRQHANLAQLSRWKIGGQASLLVEPENADQVAAIIRLMKERREPLFIMGHASNVLFDSSGFEGVVIRIGSRMSEMKITGGEVRAQAGIWVPLLARRVGCAGLSGIEHTVGIPGTLGGLILMNGGSQRKGIGMNVKRVLCVTTSGTIESLEQSDCRFDYRSSSLQGNGSVVVEATLQLQAADPSAVRRSMVEILRSRRAKFPKNLPNCGSTFLSHPKMYASIGPPGRAIEDAGLKGVSFGGAQISPLHANFIINRGGATSHDVLSLIALARRTVFERTGYMMDCEVQYVSRRGDVQPAHVAADALPQRSERAGGSR